MTLSPHRGDATEPVFRAFHEGLREALSAWLAGKPIRVLQSS